MKKYKEPLIWLYKNISIILLMIVFFAIFSYGYDSLTRISRSLAVTLIVFLFSLIIFSKIYGMFKIGEFKSKQVIYSTWLVFIFTDLLSYFALMIMQTNPNNIYANASFELERLDLLLLTLFTHSVIIYGMTYLGNHIYFILNDPLKTVVIYNSELNIDARIERYLHNLKKQYHVVDVLTTNHENVEKIITEVDYVLLVDLDVSVRKNYIELCCLMDIDYAFTPSVSDISNMSGSRIIFDDKPLIQVSSSPLTFSERVLKRLMDILFSVVVLVFTIPIWMVCAIAIKIDDGGPIFFKQLRKTVNGIDFYVYKFRSMRVDSENYSATEGDDRITKVGKVLRKLRIDELPQLINIFKGEMSVVGPRPEMISNIIEYEKELSEFKYRLKVKAGLTGIAQIEGKYNTPAKDKLLMDLMYIENYSIWLDIKLMFKTLGIFFKKDSTEGFS